MSKCKEAFIEEYNCIPEALPKKWSEWQAAWNARGKVDAEICAGFLNANVYVNAAKLCAEAIEQENHE